MGRGGSEDRSMWDNPHPLPATIGFHDSLYGTPARCPSNQILQYGPEGSWLEPKPKACVYVQILPDSIFQHTMSVILALPTMLFMLFIPSPGGTFCPVWPLKPPP